MQAWDRKPSLIKWLIINEIPLLKYIVLKLKHVLEGEHGRLTASADSINLFVYLLFPYDAVCSSYYIQSNVRVILK
jgi:hypothetical protein